jgi:hypothetical protein
MDSNVSWLTKGFRRARVFIQSRCEVAQYAGIRVADIRGGSPSFLTTTLSALKLIEVYDPRRFARVKKHVHWIVNGTVSHGGQSYCHGTKTCRIDFEDKAAARHGELLAAMYAARIVHEATHAAVRGWLRVMPTGLEQRLRIERLCFFEERRFLLMLSASLASVAPLLNISFPEKEHRRILSESRIEQAMALLRRHFRRRAEKT